MAREHQVYVIACVGDSIYCVDLPCVCKRTLVDTT